MKSFDTATDLFISFPEATPKLIGSGLNGTGVTSNFRSLYVVSAVTGKVPGQYVTFTSSHFFPLHESEAFFKIFTIKSAAAKLPPVNTFFWSGKGWENVGS